MGAKASRRPSHTAFGGLMPPRRATGDPRNRMRMSVQQRLARFTDAEQEFIAELIERMEGGHELPFAEDRYLVAASAIATLRRDNPDAWR